MNNRTLIATFLAGLLVGSGIVVLWAAGDSDSPEGSRTPVDASSPDDQKREDRKARMPAPELVRMVERRTNRSFKYNPDRLRSLLVTRPEPTASGKELMANLVNQLEREQFRVVVVTERGRTVHRIVHLPEHTENQKVRLEVSRGKVNLRTAGDSEEARAGDKLFVGPNQNIYPVRSVNRVPGNASSGMAGGAQSIGSSRGGSSSNGLKPEVKKLPVLLSIEKIAGSKKNTYRWKFLRNTEIPLFVDDRYFTGSFRLVEDSHRIHEFGEGQGTWVLDLELKISEHKTEKNDNK